MRTKNARAIDALESAYLADVKRIACRVCGAPPPSFAHHVKQGFHLAVCGICYECHQGSGGIHGNKSRWRVARITELQAVNETVRAVLRLRSGGSAYFAAPKPQQRTTKRASNTARPSKILPRNAA